MSIYNFIKFYFGKKKTQDEIACVQTEVRKISNHSVDNKDHAKSSMYDCEVERVKRVVETTEREIANLEADIKSKRERLKFLKTENKKYKKFLEPKKTNEG